VTNQDSALATAQETRRSVSAAVAQRVDSASAEAATQLQDVTGAMRRAGYRLRAEGKDQPANVLDTVTDRADQAARYLAASNSTSVLDDLERLGRTRPWLAISGGLAAGVVAARLLKSSSRRRFDDYRSRYPTGGRLHPGAGRPRK